jgi:amino acid transporter
MWLRRPRSSPSQQAIRLPGYQSGSHRQPVMWARPMPEVRRPDAEQKRGEGLGHPDLEWREVVPGQKPGDAFVRIATHKGFRRVGPGLLVPRWRADEPTSRLGRALLRLKRLVLGSPIPTSHEPHERLNKVSALAVFSSDALSSVAYGTEEIMKVLIVAGTSALSLTLPIATAIVVLLAIVVASYRQTIRAYPTGGGSYIVASDNLGILAGLTAAAALLIDYVLTVAVSVAAGVAAITSLVPSLLPYTTLLSVGGVLLIALANLRGARESATIFAAPTYAFVGIMYLLIGWGLISFVTGTLPAYEPPQGVLQPGVQALTLFLVLSAFAQGCSALTGTEAISNGVPAFQKPSADNARATILWMGVLLGTMFLGMSFLATHVGIIPTADETVLSQLGRTVFGIGPLWWALQIATALILVLAANTSFADFPRLGSILARDHFLPRAFYFRGDRLAFTAGVLTLAVLAVLLLIVFGGSVDHLIPLYAVGVFTSFTLSQAGMVRHWRRVRARGWRRSAVLNGLGASATGLVTAIIAVTKFIHGAWLVVLLIPGLVALFFAIRNHYRRLEMARRPETPLAPEEVSVRAVVPIADLGIEARQALAYARAIARDDQHVVAVHVAESISEAQRFRLQWAEWMPGIELVIIESPYRSLIGPLLAYIDALKTAYPCDTLTVVLPEFVPSRWWEQLLHNHTAFRLRMALLFHPGVVTVSVPYHGEPGGLRVPGTARTTHAPDPRRRPDACVPAVGQPNSA